MGKSKSALYQQREDTAEELIGILTAISVVSKRLAKKLASLEMNHERRDQTNGKFKDDSNAD